MKKLLFAALMFSLLQPALAQKKMTQDQKADALAKKAATIDLYAEKSILELNEQTDLKLKIVLNATGADLNGLSIDTDFDYDNTKPASEPYKIQGWRILEPGAGQVIGHDATARYFAPTSMPASKRATVVVDLLPNKPGAPKIELLHVIYIEDAPMAFYFDSPEAGIVREKYTFPSGANTMDQLAGMTLPAGASAAQMQKMADLQKQLAQVRGQANAAMAEKGYNADALMSNAKAIYTASGDVTLLQVMGKAKVTKDGKDAGTKNVMITLTFPGKNNGLKYIKGNKNTTAHIIFRDQQLSYGCENDPKANPKEEGIHCSGGIINVSSYTDTEVKGTIHAQLEGYNSKGTLDGKFILKVANK